MAKAVIIGYGNPLRGDDGLGWYAVSLLQKQFTGSQVRFITEHQLTPEMAEDVADANLVVFIDAREGDRPGEIGSELVYPESARFSPFSHTLTPGAVLGLASRQYQAELYGVLFTVTGQEFGFQETLSPLIKQKTNKLARQISKCLQSILTGSTEKCSHRPPVL